MKEYAHNGWVHFEIVKGCYGLSQAGRLANDLLPEKLLKQGYYEAETPGRWKHASRLIEFVLVVDDFFVQYVGREHAEHLGNMLKKYHTILEDWTTKKLLGSIRNRIMLSTYEKLY